jgi:predicted nucleic acid-binding Zn ribbon protein
MLPLRDTASRVVRDLLATQPTTAAKVGFAWRMAAGAALARATSVTWRDDGVLVVSTRSDAWQREAARARPVLLTRLTALLGPGVVRSIRVIEDASCEKP